MALTPEAQVGTPRPDARYDAFISYSHAADGKLAAAVQTGLQRLARPMLKARALRVFRDKTSLSATPHLWGSIEGALLDSAFFIYMASPEAARSPWVNRELETWTAARPSERLLIAVTDGGCSWDTASEDFDWTASTAIPRTLAGVFPEEPLYVDLRWARSETDLSLQHTRFRDAIADLAAPIHGMAKEDLEGEDVRRHRRTRRFIRATVATLAVLLLAAVGFAIRSEREQGKAEVNAALAVQEAARAEREADRATDAAMRAESEAIRAAAQETLAIAGRVAAQAELVRGEPDLALLLHLAAVEVADIAATRHSLIRTLAETRIERYARVERGPYNTAIARPALSAGGRRVAFASTEGAVSLWDVDEGEVAAGVVSTDADGRVWRIRADALGPREIPIPAFDLAVTPDGSTVAIKPYVGPVLWWSPAEGDLQLLETRECQAAALAVLAISDEGMVACAGESVSGGGAPEISVEVWARDLRRLRSLPLPHPPTEIVFAPGGRHLAVASETALSEEDPESVLLLDTATGSRQELALPGSEADEVLSLAFSPDGRLLAAGTFRGNVLVWDRRDSPPSLVANLTGHSNQVTALAFGPSGARLFSGDAGGDVVGWGLEALGGATEESEIFERFEAHASTVQAIHVASDEALVTVGDEAVSRWGLGRPPIQSGLAGGEEPALDVAVAGSTVVSIAPFGRLIGWDSATLDERSIDFAREDEGFLTVAAAADGSRLAAGRFLIRPDAIALEVWDLPSGERHRLRGERVVDVVLSGDGSLVAATESGTGVVVWDLDDGQVERIPDQGIGFPVALTAGAELLAYLTGSAVAVRDPRDLADVRMIEGLDDGVGELAFSPDSSTLAVGTHSGDVQLFGTQDLALTHSFEDPGGQVTAMTFDASGGILAVGTTDGVIHLFDAVAGERIAQLGERRPFRTVGGLAFSADGQLFAATEDGVSVWDIRIEALRATACRLAGRDITEAEWEQHLPERPYAKLCATG